MKLKDKVAVVVAQGSEWDRAIAILFAEEGSHVALVSPRADFGEETVSKILDRECRAVYFVSSLKKAVDVDKIFYRIAEKYKKIDLLYCGLDLKKSYYIIRAAVPYLLRNGSGSIILHSGISQFRTELTAFTKNLALEFAPHQIRVNSICSGEMNHRFYSQSRYGLKTDPKLVREGWPEDVAFAALFFASNDASWITGNTLVIDGGSCLGVMPGHS